MGAFLIVEKYPKTRLLSRYRPNKRTVFQTHCVQTWKTVFPFCATFHKQDKPTQNGGYLSIGNNLPGSFVLRVVYFLLI